VDKSANDAALNIVKQKTGKKTKPCRVAIQILQQDTKNDKIKYFMGWENPNAQRSWSWADDVTEDLKRPFYKNHPLEGGPQSMALDYTNKPTFNSHSRNGEVMSH